MTAILAALAIVSTAMAIPDNPCPKDWQYLLADVRPGETTVTKLARRLRMDPKALAGWNDLSPNSALEPGQMVVFCRDSRPGSVGYPWKGRLRGGVNIDIDGDGRGCGWVVAPGRKTTWGTPETVASVSDCLCRYKSRFPNAPDVSLGDISRKTGRRLSRHLSHQSGRDIDLGYVTNPPQTGGHFNRRARYRNLDAPRQWWILQCLLDKGNVKYMFMNWAAISVLKKHVQSDPALADYLKFFPGGSEPVIAHDRAHYSHIHVRFTCPPDDTECRDR